jgi:predicted nucleotidyltransferase
MNRADRDIPGTLGRFFEASAWTGLISAYLFGSHAAGRAHRDSDVDVGVLLAPGVYATARERFDAGVRLSAELGTALATDRVDLLVLNDGPPHLGRHVVTAGRRVWVADPERDHAFVRDVQLRAADLEPFLRRTQRLKLAAIAR